jgi:hypothetical protein
MVFIFKNQQMPNYNKAKIYSIRSFQTEKIYIGSTCQPLQYRFHEHKRNYKGFLMGKRNYTSSQEILKYGDAYIELIHETPCNSRMELAKYEGQFIRSMNCVNKQIEGRTNRERYYDNQEERKEYGKKYYYKNKKEINKKKCKKYICICGKTATAVHKNRHDKTKKHRQYIFNLHNELNHL